MKKITYAFDRNGKNEYFSCNINLLLLYLKMDSLVAGACAGMLSRTCSAPFERLKILGQCSLEPIDYVEEFKKIHKRDGPRAFWRGNMTNCIRIAPNSAIQFMTFDLLNKYSSNNFLTGGLSGAIAMIACYPLDYCRSILTVQQGKQSLKLSQFILNSIRQHGIKSIYKGLTFSMCATVPYNALNFGIYIKLIPMVEHWRENQPKQFSVSNSLVSGLIAGWTTGVITYPFDIIRRRMQLRGSSWNGGQMHNYSSVFQCIKQIYTEYGIRGFYKGLPPCMIQTPISVSVSLTGFEVIKSLFDIKTKPGSL
jgi:solute carrier family 25 phosphate transporter 23/24/25/41